MKRKIELSHESLNVILRALAEIPYKFAAPVLDEINRQLKNGDGEADGGG